MVIEAVLFTQETLIETLDFLREGKVKYLIKREGILLRTPSGDMLAVHGDYIVHGLMNEYYPCKTAAFEANYEALGARE